MKQLLQISWIAIGLLSLLMLSACCPVKVIDLPIAIVPPPPCIITYPTRPTDAMGQLGIRIIRVGDEVRVIIPSDRVFTVNTAEIQDTAEPGLNQLASYLENYGCIPMTVSAYTDDIAAPRIQRWLAEQQARSMTTYLWTRGVSHELITPNVVGSAEYGTVASNRSVSGSAVNRRVEITFRAPPPSRLSTWF